MLMKTSYLFDYGKPSDAKITLSVNYMVLWAGLGWMYLSKTNVTFATGSTAIRY